MDSTSRPSGFRTFVGGSILFLKVDAVAKVAQPNLKTTIAICAAEKIVSSTGDGDADIVKSGKQQCRQNVIPRSRIDSICGKLTKGASSGSLSSCIVNGSAGNVIRIWSANGFLCLEVLIRPHFIDIRTFTQVLVRIVTGLGYRLGLYQLVSQKEVEGIPFWLAGPALVTRDL